VSLLRAGGASQVYDLAVGLAHAWAAARRGRRVIVIERDLRANGASIRNFGFITVSGQARGETWTFGSRSRETWAEIAPKAGIAIQHAGKAVLLRRPEAVSVAEAFLKTEMGLGCELLDAGALRRRLPQLAGPESLGALVSTREIRVESREAIPRLAAWLGQALGVTFLFGAAVHVVEPPRIATSRGEIRATRAIVCPGDDFSTLFPERIAAHGLQRCRLSMLRLGSPGFRWPTGVMSDLSLARYAGYADLAQAGALKARLAAEQPRHLANGVHLIAVGGADGGLVVGDSHHYADLPAPFAPAEAEALILDEFEAATGIAPPPVRERWTGTYAASPDRTFLIDSPAPDVRLVIVTSGCGASIAFGLAEHALAGLMQEEPAG